MRVWTAWVSIRKVDTDARLWYNNCKRYGGVLPSGKGSMDMLEFKFDTQLLIEGTGLDEDAINEYIIAHFEGDSLLVVGDDELIKIHFHTNRPWEVLEYCASLGEIYDVVVENMERQANGLKG